MRILAEFIAAYAMKKAALVMCLAFLTTMFLPVSQTIAQEDNDATYVMGPSGGNGGREFKVDNIRGGSRIGSITIRHGKKIDAISYTIVDNNTGRVLKAPSHGGRGGGETTIHFDRDEYIKTIEGRNGGMVDGFRIHTNKRVTEWFGGYGGSNLFCYQAPPGYEIIGFIGRSGGLIDALGVLIRKRESM